MTITKAIQHFIYKFQNHWKATERDQQALNTLIDFVNNKHSSQFTNHELFAKAYIFAYAIMLDKYKTTVFDPIPQKELNRYLKQPIERCIERFKDKLNETELYERIDKIKLGNKLADTLKEVPGKDFYNETWDLKTVEDNLVTQINHVLNENT